MKPEILQIEPLMAQFQARLEAAYTVHPLAAVRDDLAKVAPAVRAVVTGGGSGIANAVMDALPALEIVAVNGVGLDAVDLEHARARGVHVTYTPDVLTDDVADMAIALLLATARQLCVGDRFVRDGRWGHDASLPLARKASGKRLGIVGLGRIGRAIAHRGVAFGMDVAYTDLRTIEGMAYPFVANLVDLAKRSDFLVVSASGGPRSKGVVNAEVLDALGPEGILVNVARGSVVDEPALVAALTSGRLGGAGLDVFAHEPSVPEALRHMDNVVLQPHRASATVETRLGMGELVLANLAAHFAGEPLVTPVV